MTRLHERGHWLPVQVDDMIVTMEMELVQGDEQRGVFIRNKKHKWVYDLYLHHLDNIHYSPCYSSPFMLHFLHALVLPEPLCSFHVNPLPFCFFMSRPSSRAGCFALQQLSERNSMPSAPTAGSSSSQQKQHSPVLWLWWRSLTSSLTLQSPHPFSALSHDCPFPRWEQVFIAQMLLISPALHSFYHLFLRNVAQVRIIYSDYVLFALDAVRIIVDRKVFSFLWFIDTCVMNLSFLTTVCFLIWVLWIPRICHC